MRLDDPAVVEPVDETPRPALQMLAQAHQLLLVGRAFGAHEVLEARWKSCPVAERDLWQGLAQLCVGVTHGQRGNVRGAARLLRRGAGRLREYRGPTHTVPCRAVIDWAENAADAVEAGRPPAPEELAELLGIDRAPRAEAAHWGAGVVAVIGAEPATVSEPAPASEPAPCPPVSERPPGGVVMSLPRPAEPSAELIVLVNEAGQPIGTAPKLASHHRDTPLHLAFSSYVFDAAGRFLLTRRALTKKTWPGIWTNSCCGHPAPGEAVEDAVRRRLADELGLRAVELTPLLPDFRYWAELDGVVENEICPVFGVRVDAEPVLNDDEVAEYRWVDWQDVLAGRLDVPLSPWCQLQIEQLAGLPAVAELTTPR